jgi:hypothetical protein
MIAYNTALKNTLMTTVADGGKPFAEVFNDATLRIYGTWGRPASPDDSVDPANIYLEITGVSFSTATGGKVSKPEGVTWSGTVLQTGHVIWFRLLSGDGESLDGDVGVQGDLRFLSHEWEADDTIEIEQLSFELL